MRLNGMIVLLQGAIDVAPMSFVAVATKKKKILVRMQRTDIGKGRALQLFVLKLVATIKKGFYEEI